MLKRALHMILAVIFFCCTAFGLKDSTPVFADVVLEEGETQDPDPISSTYTVDNLTYYDVGSAQFSQEKMLFFKDLLQKRTSNLKTGKWTETGLIQEQEPSSIADQWLVLGAGIMYQYGNYLAQQAELRRVLEQAAQNGTGTEDYYTATRVDMSAMRISGTSNPMSSLKNAEAWALQKVFGNSAPIGNFQNNTTNQEVLATAVGATRGDGMKHAVVAYFTNFRVFALMPEDEGSTYITNITKNNVNETSTIAHAVKNETGSTVTGSQSITNSTTASASSSVNGSASYSFTEGVKVGAGFEFTKAFKVSGELSFSATQAFSAGWGTSTTLSDTRSSTRSISIPLAPYTQAVMLQTDSVSEYITKYNCPIALKYDVTLVMYDEDGIVKRSGTLYPSGANIDTNGMPMVFEFSGGTNGARGDLYDRVTHFSRPGELDKEILGWYDLGKTNSSHEYTRYAFETIMTHIPMSAAGAEYTQKLHVTDSEVSGIMPIYPLYRVKISEPGSNTIAASQVSYNNYDYYTSRLKVGDSSYTNYLSLSGFNKFDAPFYSFAKDNGYWIVTDHDGNELTAEEAPVILEKDKVSTNWRYTAVKPGSCFLVYRINEDCYFIASKPDIPIRNEDLKKTAALEIIVEEKEHEHSLKRTNAVAPTCTKDGMKAYYTCTGCGLIFSDKNGTEETDESELVVKKLGHSWGEWKVVKAPTETEEGEEECLCLNDESHTKTRTVSVLPHTHKLEKVAKKKPGCTEEGYSTYYVCKECGELFKDKKATQEIEPEDTVLEAAGHSWGEWTVVKAATETGEGEEQRVCANDASHVETRALPALNHVHTFEKTKKAAPTCEKDGNIAYYTCTGCKRIYADEEGSTPVEEEDLVLKATGHKWDGGEVTTPPTCEKNGIRTTTCENCGKTKTKKLKALGHDWTEWKVVKAATKKNAGSESRFCLNDTSHTETREIPAIGDGLKKNQFIRIYAGKITKNSIQIRWTKLEDAVMYKVYAGICGDACKDIYRLDSENAILKIKKVDGEKLDGNNCYKFYVAAFGEASNGKIKEIGRTADIHLCTKGSKYGNYSSVTLKTKRVITLQTGETAKIEAVQNKKKGVKVLKHRGICYSSTDPAVAAVHKTTGKVTAKAPGTCKIYCYSQNGLYKTVSVIVK